LSDVQQQMWPVKVEYNIRLNRTEESMNTRRRGFTLKEKKMQSSQKNCFDQEQSEWQSGRADWTCWTYRWHWENQMDGS